MGNGQFEASGNLSERYRKIGSVELHHIGEMELYEDQLTHEELIKASYQFMVDEQMEGAFVSRLRYNNNKCPYLVQMNRINVERVNGCMNTNHIFHLYFEYLPMTLSKLLSRSKGPLPDGEVRLLVGCLLEAVREMNSRETYHGDIYPEFIYVDDRAQRRYKIFDSAYFNPLKHGYYRAFNEATFCSPQILANVSERKSFPLYNFYMSDTFSIGLVALYAMTMINPIIAYTDNSKEIDYYYIENLIRIATQNEYSEYLICCVEECVKLRDRPNAEDLLECYPELLVNQGLKMSLRK